LLHAQRYGTLPLPPANRLPPEKITLGKKLFSDPRLSGGGSLPCATCHDPAHAFAGQDAANISESHAAISYSQLLDNGDYYWSITLPALIVATFGCGTGLPTQKQCLEMLGCYGAGKANKFAEICAAVVLAGETSLAGAILHGDWVSAHERLGRHRS
jgi:hydroxymethylglutaryl-CoA reductase (NADPH)